MHENTVFDASMTSTFATAVRWTAAVKSMLLEPHSSPAAHPNTPKGRGVEEGGGVEEGWRE